MKATKGDADFPANRPPAWRAAVTAVAAAGTMYVALRVLDAAIVERGFTAGLWPFLARPLSLVTGALPFAAIEILVVAYVGWILTAAVLALRAVIRRRRSTPNALAGGITRVVRDAGVLVFLFYLLWGLNYGRPGLETRAGWPAWEGADVEELTVLAEAAIAETNAAYLALHGTEDAGRPTAMPADLRELEGALADGWTRAAALLPISATAAAPHGRVKWPLASEIMARLGISGIYIPLTAEALVPRGLPAIRAPFAMAHEMAHQRGVTSEAEAGFFGFLVASLTPHPLARYAAAYDAQSDLLSALRGPDRNRLVALHLPGVRRDLEDLSAYYRRYRSRVSATATRVNDRYLRLNRVRGGTRDYSRSAQLLITFARQRGGVLFGDGE